MVLGMAIAQQAATGLSLREQVAAEVRAWRASAEDHPEGDGSRPGLSQASVSAIYTAVAQREIRANDPGRPRPAGHRGVTGPQARERAPSDAVPGRAQEAPTLTPGRVSPGPAGPPRVIRSDPGGAGRGYCARMPLHEGSREGNRSCTHEPPSSWPPPSCSPGAPRPASPTGTERGAVADPRAPDPRLAGHQLSGSRLDHGRHLPHRRLPGPHPGCDHLPGRCGRLPDRPGHVLGGARGRLDHGRPGGVVSVLSAEGRRIGKC